MRLMRTILKPYVGDYYVDEIRVIQHGVLVNQLEIESAIRGCVESGGALLTGEPKLAFLSTTIEIHGEDMKIDGVPMSHQASIRRGFKRSCLINIAVGDDLIPRLVECFGAICKSLQQDVQKALK